jgi:hypothetical protein
MEMIRQTALGSCRFAGARRLSQRLRRVGRLFPAATPTIWSSCLTAVLIEMHLLLQIICICIIVVGSHPIVKVIA